MKITKRQLRLLIKEELKAVLNERIKTCSNSPIRMTRDILDFAKEALEDPLYRKDVGYGEEVDANGYLRAIIETVECLGQDLIALANKCPQLNKSK